MTRCKKVVVATAAGTIAAAAVTFVFPLGGLAWFYITWSAAAGSAAGGAAAGAAGSALALSLQGNEMVAHETLKNDEGAALKRKVDNLETTIEAALNENEKLKKENDELRRRT